MTKITYSIETLYHFNCHNCGGWWSVGDAPNLPVWTCPRCGFRAIAKPVEKVVNVLARSEWPGEK